MTREEHIARAMLLGMHYHDGNGVDPFYFKMNPDGTINSNSYLNAETLEPLRLWYENETINWGDLATKSKRSRRLAEQGFPVR